jgi:hypothetical protein
VGVYVDVLVGVKVGVALGVCEKMIGVNVLGWANVRVIMLKGGVTLGVRVLGSVTESGGVTLGVWVADPEGSVTDRMINPRQ